MIELRGLSAGYNGRSTIQDISLSFPPGAVTVLLGPNGSGKSTLLRAAAGLIPHRAGDVLIGGRPIEALSRRQIAQAVTYLPQSRPTPSITARRMVQHGRFPYLAYPRRLRAEDRAAVDAALARAEAADIADRPMQELSGGQRQKVYLAMALAQDTQTVFMDEPTTYLDVRYQLDLMQTARDLAEAGKAVVLVLHDLCLAMRTADSVAVMNAGRIACSGTPDEVFGGQVLDRIFHITLRRFAAESGWQYYFF